MTRSHNEVESDARTFADDANYQVLSELNEEEQDIIRTVKQFLRFCNQINIKMNVDKTFYMNAEGTDYNIKVDGVKINHQNGCKMLGIRLNNKLGIEPQIEFVTDKVKSLRYLIRTFCKVVKSEKAQTILANAYVFGNFNHASQYLNEWTLTQYNKFQTALNRALTYRTSVELRKEYHENRIEDPVIRRAVGRAIRRQRKLQGTYAHIRNLTLPQWLILERHGMRSVQNVHRENWVIRMTRLLRTGRPIAEYQDLLNYLTETAKQSRRNIRRTSDYPYFRTIQNRDRTNDKAMLYNTTPTIWLREFSKLTQELRYIIMTDRMAIQTVREYYKQRCQHEESDNVRCERCGKNQSDYRLTRIKKELINIKEIQEQVHDWHRKALRIWDGNNWIQARESEDGIHGEDDIACIIWNNSEERYATLRQLGLAENSELNEILEHLHQI